MEVKSNCFCLEAVSGNEFGDTQLRCGCLVHHDCLVQYVKSHLGDRLSLFSSAHKHDEIEMLRCAIFCPYTFAGSCKGSSKQSNSMSVLSIRTSSSLELAIQDQIIESVKTDAVNFISVQELDFLVNFEEKHSNNFAHRLQMSDVDKVRRWAKESTTTTPISKSATCLYADDIKTEVYVKATTKACPSCQTRGTHYHGHHCHHISPSNGCMGCGTNYCYRCLSTEKDNLLATGESSRCLCGSWTNFCSTENIQRYTVAEPYPHDSRCGCAFCPDCSPSKPCNYCDGRCVVCCGLVPPGPRELSSKVEMKLAAAIVEERCSAAVRLLAACQQGDVREAEKLLRSELAQILAVAPFLRTTGGRGPLHFPCRSGGSEGATDMLDLLLTHLSVTEVLEAEDASGNTALDCAAAAGNVVALRKLLRAGADANGGRRKSDGSTALMTCVEAGFPECVRLLLQSGHCDVERVNATQDTAMSLAVQSGSADMVSMLLRYRPSPATATDLVGREPLLHVAATHGHVAVALVLIGEGAGGSGLCVDETDRFGCTALHKAVSHNRLDFIEQVLLLHRANVNIADSIYQETALMKACKLGLMGVIRLLLQQDGVDTLARNRSGETAASLCRRSVSQDVRALLLIPSAAAAPPSRSGRSRKSLREDNGGVAMDMRSEKYLQQLEDSTTICPVKLRTVTKKMAAEIARARTAMRFTQAELARRLSVSKQVIQQLEAAKGISDIHLIRRLNQELCVSLIATQ